MKIFYELAGCIKVGAILEFSLEILLHENFKVYRYCYCNYDEKQLKWLITYYRPQRGSYFASQPTENKKFFH